MAVPPGTAAHWAALRLVRLQAGNAGFYRYLSSQPSAFPVHGAEPSSRKRESPCHREGSMGSVPAATASADAVSAPITSS
jgi:hypothetical protein